MSSVFKNLKSLFVIEEEGPSKQSSKKKGVKAKAKPQEIKSKPTTTPSGAVKPSAGKVTQKFMDILLKAMEGNNLQGFDYLEFKQSLQSLKKMPMDEATRFQSAYAMAQTMGATPQHLIQTANHYLDVLQKEEKKFEEALAGQKLKQIGSKEQEIKQLDEFVKAKTVEIQKLTKEIESHQKRANQLRQQIANSSVKVENTKNDFIASYNALVGQIAKDVESMKNYLK